MDARSVAPGAAFLFFFSSNIEKAIRNVTDKYNAAPTTSSISTECSVISSTLTDIQLFLGHPYSFSSSVISQNQLEEALKNAQDGCNLTISRLEEEVGKCAGKEASIGESPRTWSMSSLCDEVLVKGLLQQIQRQLADINSLLVAAQRNCVPEIRQLLMNDTFIGDLIDIRDSIDLRTPSTPGGYSQSLWEQFDPDTKSNYAPTPTSASGFSFSSMQSKSHSLLDGNSDADTVVSKSSSTSLRSACAKKSPRGQMGSIFFKVFKSNTEIHHAAKKGDAKKIKALLDLGVDINYEGSSGCTALHLATDCGHEAVVRVLLDNGADPTAKSSEGRTPLHSAARNGHAAVVRRLLEKGADVEAKDPSGSAALHIAAYNGQEFVVKVLLERHPFIEVRGPSGFTALHVAAYNGKSGVVQLLVGMGADLEARSDTGRTSLQLAAEKGHEAVVRHLLQHGANIMAKDSIGRTALQGAVSNQHGVVAQLLLEKIVVPEVPSRWPVQQRSGSVSVSVFEVGSTEPASHVAELDATESPIRPRQVSHTPIYELPDSSVKAELPAGELNTALSSPTSIIRRTIPVVNRKRLGRT